MAEKRAFRKVFKESKDEILTLLVDAKVRENTFKKGTSFTSDEKLANVDFHKFRYFDVAVNILEDGTLEIVGFYPEE